MPDFSKTNKAQVWSCGGGTQSCAIAALIVQGKLPKPDFSVIADTGYETNATWEFMDRVLVPELAKVGVTLEVARASDEYAHRSGLIYFPKDGKSEWLHQIPLFRKDDLEGVFAKLSNYCTSKWKVETLSRYLKRKHKLTRPSQVRWIGFSFEEQRRWVKMQQGDEFKSGLVVMPLVDLRMNRKQCIALVESMGWGTPPRSACYMCPNHSDHEWRRLKSERADEFTKAVIIERELQKQDPYCWLHRSCVPLDQVDFSQPEDLFSRPCDSGLCFV